MLKLPKNYKNSTTEINHKIKVIKLIWSSKHAVSNYTALIKYTSCSLNTSELETNSTSNIKA